MADDSQKLQPCLAPVFYDLESKGKLDPNNKTDVFFCLRYIYLPRVNRTLKEFRAAAYSIFVIQSICFPIPDPRTCCGAGGSFPDPGTFLVSH